MTATSDTQGAAQDAAQSPEGHDPSSTERIKIRGRLLRLTHTMLFATAGVSISNGAVNSILLPLQIQGYDEANKVALLAVASTIGAIVGLIVQPIAGAVSDRTRSRFGRRAPWMVFGAAFSALSLVGMAVANDVVTIIIGVTCLGLAMHFITGPLSAVLPDRVPRGVRGTVSAVIGLGSLVGSVAGQILGASLSSTVSIAYLVLATLILVSVLAFAFLSPDSSNLDKPKNPFSVRDFLNTFWVSPRKHPDFFWGFLGRFLIFGGYYLIQGYALYILQDYIGLGDDAIKLLPALGAISIVTVILFSMIAGWASDKMGRRKPIVLIAGLFMAISLVIPWMMPNTTGIILYGILSAIGFGGYMSVDAALMSEVLPSANDFGKDLGVLNIAMNLPQVITPGLAGFLILNAGGYASLFPVGFVFSVIGALTIFGIKSVK